MRLDSALGLVAEVPDFPVPGVLFRDLNPVFAEPGAFDAVVDALAATVDPSTRLLAAVEARGFLLGGALAARLGIGVMPIRKPGKLPVVAKRLAYRLEYGTATLELPAGLTAATPVAVIDDVLATGGTLAAACTLMERAEAVVTGVSVVLELDGLGGRSMVEAITGPRLHALRVV